MHVDVASLQHHVLLHSLFEGLIFQHVRWCCIDRLVASAGRTQQRGGEDVWDPSLWVPGPPVQLMGRLQPMSYR